VLHGRAAGLSDEQLAHLNDSPLPPDVYEPSEAVIVRYAQALTRLEPITDQLYAELSQWYSPNQIIDLCLVIGASNLVNRFHATFQTDLDESTIDALSGSCPLPMPKVPGE
jgi:alkylhydroperoxidase family enzyme